MIVLDGMSLTCAEVAAIGRRLAPVEIGEEGRVRAGAAAAAARVAAERATATGGAVYGRTTGVGYNRGIEVSADDQRLSGLRLLRSHAAGPARRSRQRSGWPCWRSGLTRSLRAVLASTRAFSTC